VGLKHQQQQCVPRTVASEHMRQYVFSSANRSAAAKIGNLSLNAAPFLRDLEMCDRL